MKSTYIQCKNCNVCLKTNSETEIGLCSDCQRKIRRILRVRVEEEERSSLPSFLSPLGLENFGE